MRKLKKFRFDIILIALLISSLVTWLIVWGVTATKSSKKAVITYDNEKIMEVSLDENKEISLYELPNGKTLNYKMLIIVEDGSIRVEENDCPNHDCIKEGKKNKVGDVIVCLPNKIVIRIIES